MHRTLSRSILGTTLALLLVGCAPAAMAQQPPREARDTKEPKADGKGDAHPDPVLPHHFTPEERLTTGSVVVGGQRIVYRAAAGTLVVHPKGWDDVSARLDTGEDKPAGKGDDHDDHGKATKAEASMFYTAYFKEGAPADSRPITFLYNGGPGSATVWLHMGAFGPRRVVVAGDGHLPAAPYALQNNQFSLLDVSDLVFIDAPGAGFSRVAGLDKEKAFYGVDQDAHAFAEFIAGFLNKYGRWNSPKYLFGESYGTTRSAVLIDMLQRERLCDFNGVMLLSQILNFGLNPDTPEDDPGQDTPYVVALPTYAATAWYHHKLGSDVPQDLKALVAEVEHFALTDYALALAQGATLSEADRTAIAEKLHRYTGLPVEYIRKARLRISGGEFEKNLQDGADTTTGRLDTRFAGPTLDPLAKEADYDPFSASIGSAYVSAFNDYVRKDLKFGEDRPFRAFAFDGGGSRKWDMHHRAPGGDESEVGLNVMTDLATAMKYNPNLRVQLNAGYFDLATPFFQGVYEMQHLPIPDKLQANIEYRFYESGHMVYAQEASLRALHDNAADFIRRTSSGARPPARPVAAAAPAAGPAGGVAIGPKPGR
jgi:carboxypeptidase C (cathepsin A)